METLSLGTEQDFKNYIDLPLARIKRIMKSDEDVHMISAEVNTVYNICYMYGDVGLCTFDSVDGRWLRNWLVEWTWGTDKLTVTHQTTPPSYQFFHNAT